MHLFAHFSRFCAVIGGIMGKNIAVLASGSGTNAENIIRYFREKGSARVALVLTNRAECVRFRACQGAGSALCLVCQERLGKWRAYFVDASRV